MSEERFCTLCHQQVWFGAYGTTEDHVDFALDPDYETHYLVCVSCVNRLSGMPIIKKEEDN